jgi:hypothetical protein
MFSEGNVRAQCAMMLSGGWKGAGNQGTGEVNLLY